MTFDLPDTDLEPALDALATELVGILGTRGVNTTAAARHKVSVDQAGMSPVIAGRPPRAFADIVVFPTTVEEVRSVVRIAVRERVPLVARGKGTGNYGQVLPALGGIVVDLTRLKTIEPVGDGVITAQPGARMMDLETRAHGSDQELWIYPSTVHSTIGGFLAGGSAGTGTVANGNTRQGFVVALEVVHATDDADLVHVEGDATLPYLHSFGVTGIIVGATVRLAPRHEWRPLYASFDTLSNAAETLRMIGEILPAPRLCSVDDAALAATLPADEALFEGRASLRVLAHGDTVEAISALVEVNGGRIDAVREGPKEILKMSLISYNHPTWWLMRSAPGSYFHLEIFGDGIIDRAEEITASLPGGRLHLELGHSFNFGMINAEYTSESDVPAAMQVLTDLGIPAHNNHEWFIDQRGAELQAVAALTDPYGLLNPGKFSE